MIAVADKLQSRLTMQTVEIALILRQSDRWTGTETALTLNLGSKRHHNSFFASWRPNSSRYFS